MKSKNVLLLIPSLGFGGAERSISKLSVELSKLHNVYLVIFNNEHKPAFSTGGTLISLDIPGCHNFIYKIYFFFKRCYLLNTIKKKYNIDTAISYMEGANYVNVLSQTGEKVVISVRGSQFYDETIKGILGFVRLKLLIPILYPFADLVVALNYGIKKELVQFSGVKETKVKVIYNFYDIEEINYKAKEQIENWLAPIFDNYQTVITAGRLAPEKGLNHLLNVFAKLISTSPDIKLVIVGDGVMRNSLLKQCELLNLNFWSPWGKSSVDQINFKTTNVYFLGFKENPFKYISRATLFTLTSSSEGGPNILSEAMICGTPAISVDCPSGPREKLTTSTYLPKQISKAEYADYGILMPMLNIVDNKSSINEWVLTLNSLLKDEGLRREYARKACKRMSDYSVEKVFSEWQAIL